jgi:hypothetical protein
MARTNCETGLRVSGLIMRHRMKALRASPAPASRAHHARTRRDYLPLLIVLAVTALAATATDQAYDGDRNGMHWMQDFMGFFLVVFAMLKLFSLSRFADGFQMYDLLARHFRPYALAYPFIELALGLAYLAEWKSGVVYPTTIVVMLFGALGVVQALIRGLDVNCACMGNILKVPLSTVALLENLGMAAMAAVMWLQPG